MKENVFFPKLESFIYWDDYRIWIQEIIQIEAAIVSKSNTNQRKHIDEDDNNWFSLKSGMKNDYRIGCII